MKTTLIKELRKAIDNNQKSITINAETRTMQVTGESTVHDAVIETEIEGILEPLYAPLKAGAISMAIRCSFL